MRRDTLTFSLRRESLERRRFHKLYAIAFVPRAARIWLSTVSDSGRVVKILADKIRTRGQTSDRKRQSAWRNVTDTSEAMRSVMQPMY